MKGNQTMDRIEKLEMEVEGLRNAIKKKMAKKLGMNITEFDKIDKMNEIPEKKECNCGGHHDNTGMGGMY